LTACATDPKAKKLFDIALSQSPAGSIVHRKPRKPESHRLKMNLANAAKRTEKEKKKADKAIAKENIEE
jgi:hypothetical protein